VIIIFILLSRHALDVALMKHVLYYIVVATVVAPGGAGIGHVALLPIQYQLTLDHQYTTLLPSTIAGFSAFSNSLVLLTCSFLVSGLLWGLPPALVVDE
jgi:hypothetical protein